MSRVRRVLVFAVLGAGLAAAQNPLFTGKCGVCHGAEAKGGDRGLALASNRRLGARSVEDLMVAGRQYVAIASGANIIAFVLP